MTSACILNAHRVGQNGAIAVAEGEEVVLAAVLAKMVVIQRVHISSPSQAGVALRLAKKQTAKALSMSYIDNELLTF